MEILLKYLKWIVAIMLPLFVVYKIWSYTHNKNFVENNFIKYTGLNEYIIKINYYDNSQSYFEVIISQSNKRVLLSNYTFEENLKKLNGRVEPNFFQPNSKYVYYVIEKGYGPYGYIFFALEKEGNTLIVYEYYGN